MSSWYCSGSGFVAGAGARAGPAAVFSFDLRTTSFGIGLDETIMKWNGI